MSGERKNEIAGLHSHSFILLAVTGWIGGGERGVSYMSTHCVRVCHTARAISSIIPFLTIIIPIAARSMLIILANALVPFSPST